MSEISLATATWNALLSIGLLVMGYFIKKRDDRIDQNDEAIERHRATHAALELKIAENYATKATVLALLSESSASHERGMARVEKRIDETNAAISKQGDKIDKVADSINSFQTSVMHELAKKT